LGKDKKIWSHDGCYIFLYSPWCTMSASKVSNPSC